MLTNGHATVKSIVSLPTLAAPTRPTAPEDSHPEEDVRHAIETARSTCDQLETQAIELQKSIRREERAVAQWSRQVKEAEEQLTRWRASLIEAESRLEHARQEFTALAQRSRSVRSALASESVRWRAPRVA